MTNAASLRTGATPRCRSKDAVTRAGAEGCQNSDLTFERGFTVDRRTSACGVTKIASYLQIDDFSVRAPSL